MGLTAQNQGKIKTKKQTSTFSTIRELLEKQFPPQEWIVDKIIPEDAVVLISAQPASFKTWLMLEISRDVAEGKSLLNQFPAEQSPVLILDEESGERQLNSHFKILGVDSGLPIYYSSLNGKILDEGYANGIIDFCNENAVKLVIFDSLTRFHNSDENDSSAMSKVMSYFTQLKKAGITSLIIHHTRKPNTKNPFSLRNTATDIRGSSDILAACDVHIGVFRKDNTITVVQTKNRFNEELMPFTASFCKVDDQHSEWKFGKFGKTNEAQKAELEEQIYQIIEANQGINQKQIVALAKEKDSAYSDSNVRSFINSLVEKEQLVKNKGPRTELLYFTSDHQIRGFQNE